MMVHDVDSMNIRLTIEYLLLVLLDAVADLRGGGARSRRSPLPTAQNFLNFMYFFEKFGKIICWRPLLWGILDPPLRRRLLQENTNYKAINPF